MLGLDDAQTLAHAIEDVLESAREAGEFPLRLADPLLRAADALRLHIAGRKRAHARSAGGARRELVHAPPTARPSCRRHSQAKSRTESTSSPPSENGAAIRVAPQKIDRLLDLVGETVLHRRRLEHVLGGDRTTAGEDVSDELDHGERLARRAEGRSDRDADAAALVDHRRPLPRAVRDIAAATGKEVELVVERGRAPSSTASSSRASPSRSSTSCATRSATGSRPPDERRRAGKPPRATRRAPRRAARRHRRDRRRRRRARRLERDPRGGAAGRLARRRPRTRRLLDGGGGHRALRSRRRARRRQAARRVVRRHARGVQRAGYRHPDHRSSCRSRSRCSTCCSSSAAATSSACRSRASRRSIAVESSLTRREGPRSSSADASIPLADLAELVGVAAPPLARRAPAVVVASGGRRVATCCDRPARRGGGRRQAARPAARLRDGLPRRRDPRRRAHRAAARSRGADPGEPPERVSRRPARRPSSRRGARRRCSSSRTPHRARASAQHSRGRRLSRRDGAGRTGSDSTECRATTRSTS